MRTRTVEQKQRHAAEETARYRRNNWEGVPTAPESRRLFMFALVALLFRKEKLRLEKSRARYVRYADRHPERLALKNRQQTIKHADRILATARRRMYGLTPKDYIRLFEAQNGKCAVCQEPLQKKFHTDHNHATGEVRGLLCAGCNTGLGFFKDSPTRLWQAVAYLEKQ